MSYTLYSDENYVDAGVSSAALNLEVKAFELATITALNLASISVDSALASAADIDLAQGGAFIHGQIENKELLGLKLESARSQYIGTSKEAYYTHLINNNNLRINNLKDEFASINGEADYQTAKSSFDFKFFGVIGHIGTAVGIGYTLDKQIEALDDKIESGIANNIPADQVFI